MTEKSNEMNWLRLLSVIDGLNRRVKEPGWSYEDKEEVYRLKDSIMESVLEMKPEELTLELYLIPYYAYSEQSKDKAGALMRSDPDRKPFEYYLGQIAPGPYDREIPEKATVEFLITCAGQEFSFHQPLNWYTAHGGDSGALTKKVWISSENFHHAFLEKARNDISALQTELKLT